MSQRNQPIISGIDGTVTVHSDVAASTSATLLNNWTAVVAPVVTDDSASGYAVGSEWTDVTADKSYKLVDASIGAAVWKETTGGADKYYSQNLIDTTGGTIDAPYGTPAILTSSANFYITVVETGTYIIHGSVNIDDDLNKDNNALELIYGIDTGSGAAIGPVPYQQNLQGKKKKRNGIQGTWLGVSLTAGDKVHMYMSTCDDSCTWLGGRIFIAQWK